MKYALVFAHRSDDGEKVVAPFDSDQAAFDWADGTADQVRSTGAEWHAQYQVLPLKWVAS